MDWWFEIKTVWTQYRWWLCGGLATILVAAVIGGVVLTHNADSKQTDEQSMPQISETNSVRASSSIQPVNQSKVATHGKIMVEVKGAVNHAGVYQFTGDARVLAAIKRAGGLRADADEKQLNQAKRLADQMVVYVPMVGEKIPEAAASAGPSDVSGVSTSESGATGEAIDLNAATKEQLTTLTGVGDKKAQKIIDYRTSHGGFKQVDELKQVPGFGDKTVQQLAPHLRLS